MYGCLLSSWLCRTSAFPVSSLSLRTAVVSSVITNPTHHVSTGCLVSWSCLVTYAYASLSFSVSLVSIIAIVFAAATTAAAPPQTRTASCSGTLRGARWMMGGSRRHPTKTCAIGIGGSGPGRLTPTRRAPRTCTTTSPSVRFFFRFCFACAFVGCTRLFLFLPLSDARPRQRRDMPAFSRLAAKHGAISLFVP